MSGRELRRLVPRAGEHGDEREERALHLLRRREAPGGARVHRAVNRRDEGGRERRIDCRERRHAPFEDRARDRLRVDAVDRATTDEHLEQHHPERVEIGARVDRVRRKCLFRRHVLRRPEDDAWTGETRHRLRCRAELGDPEVEHLREGALRSRYEEDVVGLEIAVDDAQRVRDREPGEDLERDVERERAIEAVLAIEALLERLAGEELHHEERSARVLLDVGHRHDVEAPDLRRHPRLLDEARDEPLPARELGVEHLHRDARPEGAVASLVDGAHPAFRDRADDTVLTA